MPYLILLTLFRSNEIFERFHERLNLSEWSRSNCILFEPSKRVQLLWMTKSTNIVCCVKSCSEGLFALLLKNLSYFLNPKRSVFFWFFHGKSQKKTDLLGFQKKLMIFFWENNQKKTTIFSLDKRTKVFLFSRLCNWFPWIFP